MSLILLFIQPMNMLKLIMKLRYPIEWLSRLPLCHVIIAFLIGLSDIMVVQYYCQNANYFDSNNTFYYCDGK